MDRIVLDGFAIDCIVGITPRERVERQRIVVDLTMWLDLEASGDHDDLSKSVNYADVQAQLGMLATHGQWWLIETCALASLRLLLAPPAGEARAAIAEAEIAIRKPEILRGATPGVVFRRPAAWWSPVVRRVGAARVEVLAENPRRGAYRVGLPAGATFEVEAGMGLHVLAGSVSPRLGADLLEGATTVMAETDASLLVAGVPLSA